MDSAVVGAFLSGLAGVLVTQIVSIYRDRRRERIQRQEMLQEHMENQLLALDKKVDEIIRKQAGLEGVVQGVLNRPRSTDERPV